MKSYHIFIKTFRLLHKHKPGRLLLISILTLFLGLSSGFSVVLLIPFLQLLNIGENQPAEGFVLLFRNLADKAGIELTLELVVLIYILLFTFNALIQYWRSIMNSRFQQTFIYELRRRLFRKIIFADWPELNSKSKTNHLQVLTKEVPNMANFVMFYMRLLISLIILVSYTAWAMVVSARFTLLIIIVGGLLMLLARNFLLRSFRLGKGFVDSYNHLLKHINDFWQTVKIAKVHNSEDFYYSKYDVANTSLLDLEFRSQKNWSVQELLYNFTGIIILVTVIYAGYKLDIMPLTSFFILILLFARMFPQFTAINNLVNMILSNVASVNLVMKLDEEFPEPVLNKHSGNAPVALEQGISLEEVSFTYPDGEHLFEGFSEIIPAKKITGIVGDSGRGKTTLIDLIAGLQKPDNGAIKVDGWLLDDKMLSRWKSSIGYLPQDPFFIDGSLRENLVWDSSPSISDDDVMEMLRKVNAVPLVERFSGGLDTPVMNYQFQFSGGERQRLALARVLLRYPRLLLLDEATSSLDPENERQVMEVIAGLKKSVTIVFVTHRISLYPWFDKIIKI